MPRDLEPTPERIAVAKRVATREWTVGHDEAAFSGIETAHRELIDAGMVVLHLPPTRLRLDYWTLTPRGHEWLARAEAATQ